MLEEKKKSLWVLFWGDIICFKEVGIWKYSKLAIISVGICWVRVYSLCSLSPALDFYCQQSQLKAPCLIRSYVVDLEKTFFSTRILFNFDKY